MHDVRQLGPSVAFQRDEHSSPLLGEQTEQCVLCGVLSHDTVNNAPRPGVPGTRPVTRSEAALAGYAGLTWTNT
ncbi:hypothetical protein GCM10010451_50300 [Streptomyces virens]|uniref:DUF397 domain-containing protein n=1 Tax=Streptomyces virens TaxID=285572 RepID=A0ABP6PZB7_9ACTN